MQSGDSKLQIVAQNPVDNFKNVYAVTFALLGPRRSRISKIFSGEYKNTLRIEYVNFKVY